MAIIQPEYRALEDRIKDTSVSMNFERVRQAWDVAEKAYENQQHWTGVSTMEHVLGVLETLLPFQPDEESIIACLLHHVLQCKYLTVTELEQQFGSKIRELVSGVHLLSHVTLHDRRVSIDDLKLMLVTVSDDIRTILIVLCDRYTIVRSTPKMEPSMARRVSQDVLQLFAPVAARLGMYSLKHSMEAIAFPVCYAQDAESIAEQMVQLQKRHGNFLEQITGAVQEYLLEHGIQAKIEARQKQPYSVFRKMNQKSITHISDLYDFYALRVIVKDEPTCYQTLGLLHQMGRPVGNRFKDYIAFPKPNGYRSLHTTLAQIHGTSTDGALVEVQVRTAEMHREANYGIAAHWMYKEGGKASQAALFIQLQDALSAQNSIADHNALADHIFVLTPRGDVVELPEGATPLDFAFHVHTDLGLSFRGARVNGSMVPMDYQLENGDLIEILKHKTPQPSSHWLQLLKMGSSRAKLKRFLYAQQRPELIARGRELLNEELRKHRYAPLDTSLSILRSYNGETLNVQEREDLLVKLGQGAERARMMLPKLEALQAQQDVSQKSEVTGKSWDTGTDAKKAHLVIENGLQMPHRFAKCCQAEEWPRESLQGVVTRKGKIMVHRGSCGMLRNANPERKVRVWWEE